MLVVSNIVRMVTQTDVLLLYFLYLRKSQSEMFRITSLKFLSDWGFDVDS